MRREWERWSNSLAESVASFARSVPRPLHIDSIASKRVEVPENEFAAGGTGAKPLIWHLLDFGSFRIVGINAEPVVKYRRLLEQSLYGVPLLTVGCLDQPVCYLPTDNMIPERGYEVEGFRTLFDFTPKFRDHLQEKIIQKLSKTATPAT
jgi:hypothetical protein